MCCPRYVVAGTMAATQWMAGHRTENSLNFIVIGGTLTSADGQTNLDVRVGCDWMTVHSDYAEIDARVCCNSPPSDGRALNLDLEYKGRINLSEMAVQLMGGMGETVDAAYYFTTVYLSSRSAELSWVNSSVFVGNGKLMANKDNAPVVRYRIYRVS